MRQQRRGDASVATTAGHQSPVRSKMLTIFSVPLLAADGMVVTVGGQPRPCWSGGVLPSATVPKSSRGCLASSERSLSSWTTDCFPIYEEFEDFFDCGYVLHWKIWR